jgi:hypothetical protein
LRGNLGQLPFRGMDKRKLRVAITDKANKILALHGTNPEIRQIAALIIDFP